MKRAKPWAVAAIFMLSACSLHGPRTARLAEGWDWGSNVIAPNRTSIIEVGDISGNQEDDGACVDFNTWLKKENIVMITCNMRRVATTSDAGSSEAVFLFSGDVLPSWLPGDPGQSLLAQEKIGRGRWKVGLLRVPSEFFDGHINIILTAHRIERLK